MGRTKSSAPEYYAPLSGPLGEGLKTHAYERCRHYYHYAFTLHSLHQMILDRGATRSEVTWFVTNKATHQIDSGHRSSNPRHNTWVTDASVVDMPVTAFKRMDAAHFCNLGIKPELQELVKTGRVDNEIRFLENLESTMGNTRPMPQKVNIGPDRIVDDLHARMIAPDLKSDQPLISLQSITNYINNASASMKIYIHSKLRDRPGLEACANCYVEFYAAPDTVNGLYSQLATETEEECRAYGLDPAPYVK